MHVFIVFLCHLMIFNFWTQRVNGGPIVYNNEDYGFETTIQLIGLYQTEFAQLKEELSKSTSDTLERLVWIRHDGKEQPDENTVMRIRELDFVLNHLAEYIQLMGSIKALLPCEETGQQLEKIHQLASASQQSLLLTLLFDTFIIDLHKKCIVRKVSEQIFRPASIVQQFVEIYTDAPMALATRSHTVEYCRLVNTLANWGLSSEGNEEALLMNAIQSHGSLEQTSQLIIDDLSTADPMANNGFADGLDLNMEPQQIDLNQRTTPSWADGYYQEPNRVLRFKKSCQHYNEMLSLVWRSVDQLGQVANTMGNGVAVFNNQFVASYLPFRYASICRLLSRA